METLFALQPKKVKSLSGPLSLSLHVLDNEVGTKIEYIC